MPRGVPNRPRERDQAPGPVVMLAPSAAREHAQPVTPARLSDPMQSGRPIALMDEAELRQYAVQVGITRTDAERLTVESLRSNCIHKLHELYED